MAGWEIDVTRCYFSIVSKFPAPPGPAETGGRQIAAGDRPGGERRARRLAVLAHLVVLEPVGRRLGGQRATEESREESE